MGDEKQQSDVFPKGNPEEALSLWRVMVEMAINELPSDSKSVEAQQVLKYHNAVADLLNQANLSNAQNIAIVDMLMLQMVRDFQDQIDVKVMERMKHLQGKPHV
jgi:hypothetical protein